MLGFIQNWFNRKVKQALVQPAPPKDNWDDTGIHSLTLNSAKSSTRSRQLDRDPTMQFKLHKAENGWVVEMFGYDEKADRSFSRLNLILDGTDFDKELSHIVTMQALRNPQ